MTTPGGIETERPTRPMWRVWAFSAVLTALAALTYVTVPTHWTLHGMPGSFAGLLALTAAIAIAEACVLHLVFGRNAHAFAFVELPLVVGILFFPPAAVLTARLVGSAVVLLTIRRTPLTKLVFNLAQHALGVAAALAVYTTFASPGAHTRVASLVALAATVTCELISVGAITTVIALVGDGIDATAVGRTVTTGLLSAASNTALAIVAVSVVRTDTTALWALVVIGAVISIAQRAYIRLQRRHSALERLTELASRLSRDLHAEAVAEEILRGASRTMEGAVVDLEIVHGEDVTRMRYDGVRIDAAPEAPVPLDEPSRRLGLRRQSFAVRAALTAHGTTLGHLTVSTAAPVPSFGVDERALVGAIAHHASIALTNARLADELRVQLSENEHQATHDPLTGLANRLMFERVVEAMLNRSRSIAVLLFDLDRFKEVNDTLGHAAGDALLRDVGERLRAAVPKALCIARLGGDEFTILLTGADEPAAVAAAESAREALLKQLEVNAVPVSVDASIGIAIAPGHGATCDDLLRHADVAMYAAKEGRGTVAVYDPAFDHNDASRLGLASELRDAIAGGGIYLNYQPKLDLLHAGRRASIEALARWNHPVRGFVPPDEFIAVAEQTGSIIALTDAVLTTALRDCRSWLDTGLDMSVAVNVSPRVLRDPTFADRLAGMLQTHRVPAARLTLEITESAIMDDIEHAVDVLWRLRKSGVRLSIDDLGIGQSSLAYLKRLPVHEVKIDKSFVFNMADDEDDDAIVCAVVGLAHRLRMQIVAEGVETQRTRDRLVEIGCDIAQGYWFSRPLPAEDIAPWFAGYFETLDRQPRLRVATETAADPGAAAES